MAKKLEVWQQPIIFKDPRYITLTKAEHTEMTRGLGYPLTWPARNERDRRTSNDDGTLE
jgi:hypothetical protein